jgi:hypothetical protein
MHYLITGWRGVSNCWSSDMGRGRTQLSGSELEVSGGLSLVRRGLTQRFQYPAYW